MSTNETIKPKPTAARRVVEARRAAPSAPAQVAPAAPPVSPVPAVQESKAVTAPNERDPRLEILEEGGALNRMGRPIRFNGKTGEWITADDQEPVSEETKYVAYMVAVRHGYIKFCGEGQPPKFEMGSWCEGWKAPKREELPDRDPSQWPMDYSGTEPKDPWLNNWSLPLQEIASGQFFAWDTQTWGGISAIKRLCAEFLLMEKQSPGLYPVIYLRKGRKHGRYGWSEVPVLTRCGTADRYGSGTPTTSLPAHLDEQGWMDLTPATDDGPNDPVPF